MSDLDRMWEALAQYQPFADQDGHGDSWRKMREDRTIDAVLDAEAAAAEKRTVWAAARAARLATYWISESIAHIETAIKERNHE